MIQRCSDPDHPSAKRYYHRGIRICDAWADFAVFQEWSFSHGYKEDPAAQSRSARLSINRKNTSLGYSPENCEWVTCGENARLAGVEYAQYVADLEIENKSLKARISALEAQLQLRQ